MLNLEELNALHHFQIKHHCKNESQAVSQVFLLNSRYQMIISKLEDKAHEAEEWKLRAEEKSGISSKAITAEDASKSTASKVKSVKNTKDMRTQKDMSSKEGSDGI